MTELTPSPGLGAERETAQPAADDGRHQSEAAVGLSRRRILLGGAALLGTGVIAGGGAALGWAAESVTFRDWLQRRRRDALVALADEVLPAGGIELPVSFGDSIHRLVAGGAIAPARLERLYATRGGLPEWATMLLAGSSTAPVRFSAETAPVLLTLLWPLGLANRAGFNQRSPLNSPKVGQFASTGGWTLGARPGGELFNSIGAVRLDAGQEEVVETVARASYRPCCNNSALFQDCNHGSALLGLYQLAAAQGVDTAGLYRIARIANSYWYPSQYVAAAVYFEQVEKLAWSDVAADRLMSKRYSSASGWRENILGPLRVAGLMPAASGGGGGSCAV